ncbi:transcription factor LBX1b-like [Alosa alosa]|uniref:transcription factor LBX1b-like n=1 Tax=Alosa sapidissima TaxID=34773 RepID=UPI001C090487|nr:transcription factor LBX1b-like [Alosa sapidissima]XP_048103223.1 transcription factor LBX1b-like [Alosa alosa]
MSREIATEKESHSPLDHLPPPASSNKPLTPFSIVDILSKPSVKRGTALIFADDKHAGPPGLGLLHLPKRTLVTKAPLCALEELASKTFRGLEVGVLRSVEGKDCLTLYTQQHNPKKRRKSRTAFTTNQIYALEKRFLFQKYLSPADRDQIAHQLGLTNAQVITWFQNRRAKLKRDLEELKADVKSATVIGSVPLEKLDKLADLERLVNGTAGHRSPDTQSEKQFRMPPTSPRSDHTACKESSDDEGEEIDVDD